MRLVPHLFCWRTSLIDALSSYVKRMFINKQWCYTVFPIVFPVELGCFHLFLSHYKLLKIFARNSHMLLRIDYISTCVIHFKCTLLLEDIISWRVGGWFFIAHSVYKRNNSLHVTRFCHQIRVIVLSCWFHSLYFSNILIVTNIDAYC